MKDSFRPITFSASSSERIMASSAPVSESSWEVRDGSKWACASREGCVYIKINITCRNHGVNKYRSSDSQRSQRTQRWKYLFKSIFLCSTNSYTLANLDGDKNSYAHQYANRHIIVFAYYTGNLHPNPDKHQSNHLHTLPRSHQYSPASHPAFRRAGQYLHQNHPRSVEQPMGFPIQKFQIGRLS